MRVLGFLRGGEEFTGQGEDRPAIETGRSERKVARNYPHRGPFMLQVAERKRSKFFLNLRGLDCLQLNTVQGGTFGRGYF